MLKRGKKMQVCEGNVKMQFGRSVAAVIIFFGLMGMGQFSLCAEAAQTETEQAAVEAQESGNLEMPGASGQGVVLEAEKRIEMKAAPEKTAETLMTFQKGDLIFAVGEVEDGWYHVIYQGNEGYVEEGGLARVEIDVEGLNAEMAVNEAETKFVVEVVEKYRADARRSKIWGTVIIVLVIGIFGVGIFSAVRTNRMEDEETNGKKNGDKRRKGSIEKKKREQIEIEDLN